MGGLLVPFGMRDGKMLHVSEVQSGLACNCICPKCHSKLVARKGIINQHHFAHYNEGECDKAYETAVHKAAKQILNDHKQVCLPSISAFSDRLQIEFSIKNSMNVQADSVRIEERYDNVVPDIIFEWSNGKSLFIEVAVTNKVNHNKYQKLREARQSTIEIDLSKYKDNWDWESLEEAVLSDSSNRKWIYNDRIERLLIKKEKEMAPHLFEKYNKNTSHLRKLYSYSISLPEKPGYYVHWCPLKKKSGEQDDPDAYVVDDCFTCKHFRGIKSIQAIKAVVCTEPGLGPDFHRIMPDTKKEKKANKEINDDWIHNWISCPKMIYEAAISNSSSKNPPANQSVPVLKCMMCRYHEGSYQDNTFKCGFKKALKEGDDGLDANMYKILGFDKD